MEQFSEATAKFCRAAGRAVERVAKMKETKDFIDYSKLDKIVIGVCGGDGIGPYITAHAQHILEFLLADEVKAARWSLRSLTG